MREIGRPRKPHIRFHRNGLIEILSEGSRILGLSDRSSVSFSIDDNLGVLFVRKCQDGIRPSSVKGKLYRYHCVNVCKEVYELVNWTDKYKSNIAFMFGSTVNGKTKIVTSRLIE